MTPHGVLTDMTEMVGWPGIAERFDMKRWDVAATLLGDAVHFDFGTAKPLVEHVEFGHEMQRRGMFQLPFPACVFTGGGMVSSAILVTDQDNPIWQPDGLSPGGSAGLIGIVLGKVVDPAEPHKPRIAPLTAARMSTIDLGSPDAKLWTEYRYLTRDEQRSKTGAVIDQSGIEDRIERMFDYVCGCVALLMSKDVEDRITPAPDRLNKSRETKGLPPVRERHFIKIRPEAKRAFNRRGADEEASGRQPSRMHFRRGHFRDLGFPREKDGQQIIPIPPMAINVNPDAKIRAKDYRVQPQTRG